MMGLVAMGGGGRKGKREGGREGGREVMTGHLLCTTEPDDDKYLLETCEWVLWGLFPLPFLFFIPFSLSSPQTLSVTVQIMRAEGFGQ